MLIHQDNYLESFCAPSDNPKYLLAMNIYQYRASNKKVVFGQNVASTLFVYQGNFSKPIAAESKYARELHGERLSLREAIVDAVKQQWGPFSALTIEDIPEKLSIENIQKNQRLLHVLKQLDSVHIYTERSPCDYTKNQQDTQSDKGCEVYLKQLDKTINKNSIFVYHAIPKFTTGEKAKRIIEDDSTVLQSNLELIYEKEQIVKKKMEPSADVEKLKEQEATINNKLKLKLSKTVSSVVSKEITDSSSLQETPSGQITTYGGASLLAKKFAVVSEEATLVMPPVPLEHSSEQSEPSSPEIIPNPLKSGHTIDNSNEAPPKAKAKPSPSPHT